jgi:hypothetical protein
MTDSDEEYKFKWGEDWIERKLRRRLALYERKYPGFDIERFIAWITSDKVDSRTQRWWPYMEDEDITKINKERRRQDSFTRLCNSAD